jgi:hypothetical protein
VHERNVDALMAAALPYHETPQFVRLVQVLRLEPRSLWAFLEPMQGSGAPAPRETLVLRCLTDRVRRGCGRHATGHAACSLLAALCRLFFCSSSAWQAWHTRCLGG